MSVEKYYTDDLSRASFYSHAVKVSGSLIYCSGQIPADEKGNVVDGDIKKHTVQCVKNLEKVLKHGGSSLEKVVKVNIFLSDMNDFNAMNEAYESVMPSPRPARTCVQAARLPKDVDVEIECIAAA